MSSNSALQLLNAYGGDSSDDDVPGPRVSTKRCFKDDSEASSKRSRLPLPYQFLTGKKTEEECNNAELHEGRIRSFAHERGNWASFVYIPFEATAAITELCSYIQEMLPETLRVKITADLHISLTKTVILKYHWINSFIGEVLQKLKHFRKFLLLFDGVKVYCNEERTRTFIGIETKSGKDSLLSLVSTLDQCLTDYDLETFYGDPSFHMSIAWCLGDVREELEGYLGLLNQKLGLLMEQHSQENFYVVAELVRCKVGFKLFDITLK